LISIPRSVLRTFRTVARRAGRHSSKTAAKLLIAFSCGPDGRRLRAALPEIAVEYHQAGEFGAESFNLPIAALDTWDSRGNDPITLEAQPGGGVLACWSDRGVPRQTVNEVSASDAVTFPERPSELVPNEASIWAALRDALGSADSSSTRYALNCLHLRGAQGCIEATDGRQILSQSGFSFGWHGDVLVPASPVLGCRELDHDEAVAVGRSDDWVGFSVGPWLVMLRINKAGRFPKTDDILPNHEFARSRLELSAADAKFLGDVLPRLPGDNDQDDPITLDLNGRVLVRSRESAESRPTEVELVSSRLTGEPVTLNTNRRYVERAVKLGFREAFVYGADSPVLCRDERRRFLWALLDPKSAIPRGEDPIRIESSKPPASVPTTQSQQETSMPTTETKPAATPPAQATKPSNRTKRTRPVATGSTIEQAIAMRDTLLIAARQANELARSLKMQRRQDRIVANTLASLKALQKIAG
jgi:hypothetical protein